MGQMNNNINTVNNNYPVNVSDNKMRPMYWNGGSIEQDAAHTPGARDNLGKMSYFYFVFMLKRRLHDY